MHNNKKLLLVVDMLKDFLDPDGKLYCGDKSRDIIPYVQNLVKNFIDEDNDVLFICDSHNENDLEFEMFPPHCISNTDGALVIDELSDYVAADNIIRKTRFSAFYNTNLDKLLEQANYEQVHIVGVCTNICVMYTAEELCNRDINTYVHKKGVQSFDSEAHKFALQQMKYVLGAKVI
ncbi:isochorismatase hydrolase [Desulfofarcimen acetoxidans DSM 771]|uniref:Isochorismatase hydrolase n=1 Tax=Desulfofarcimen acetoxidans (strain ATCC 49208 / DSM 771 / KCTC 5769 / VKM B-1644 / 5575) TaxID=485916 RepID=C8W1X5_DESAS|nr:isochorismatase family cysteine hydrolase [Desulfofarcimen acetoxidans]ACV63596.1 isochorismatase hydrolase [Desulfofarcimen acetoxidans DSM 771]